MKQGRPPINLIGQTYGRLTVIGEANRPYGNSIWWACRCVCGKTASVSSWQLRSGKTRSCGCLRVETGRLVGKTYGPIIGKIQGPRMAAALRKMALRKWAIKGAQTKHVKAGGTMRAKALMDKLGL